MDEYNRVIAKYDRLCEERNDNRFWAQNITEATEGVTSGPYSFVDIVLIDLNIVFHVYLFPNFI